jgi:hypothetical protein
MAVELGESGEGCAMRLLFLGLGAVALVVVFAALLLWVAAAHDKESDG